MPNAPISTCVAGFALLHGPWQQAVSGPVTKPGSAGPLNSSSPLNSAATSTANSSSPSSIAPDPNLDLLLVDVIYGNLRLTGSLPALVDQNGARYLPLKALGQALGFRIFVDSKAQTARGFLTSPKDRFSLDGRGGVYIRNGVKRTFAPSSCFESEGDLYMDSEQVAKITGLHFVWRLLKLELEVKSDTPLAIVRQAPHEAKGAVKAAMPPLPVVFTPYKAWTPPSFNIQFGAATDTSGQGPSRSSSMGFSGIGDLAFMTARYQLSADSQGKPVASLMLGREDPQARLLGPLRATSAQMGDLNFSPIPLLSRGTNALGVAVSNFPLTGEDSSLGEQIEGLAPAGCIVELYRDNVRVAAVVADAKGHYIFTGLQLASGPNYFSIVAIELDGEMKEEERVLYGDTSGPKPGVRRYRLSAGQTASSLLGARAYEGDVRRRQAVGEYQIGLTSGSWLSATAAQIQGDGVDGSYAGLGYHAWGGGMQWHLNGMTDAGGASAFSAGVWRKLGRGSISLEHSRLNGDFHTGVLPEVGANATSVTNLRLNGIGVVGHVPWSYGLGIDRYEGPSPTTLLRGRFSGNLGDVFVSNSLSTTLSNGLFDANGFLQMRKKLRASYLRFDMGYGIGLTRGVQNMRLALDRRISADYRMQYGVGYERSESASLSTSGTLFRQIGPAAIGLGLTIDDRGKVKANLLFALGGSPGNSVGEFKLTRPGANDMGSVAVRVYLDRNGSGKYDKGDTLLPGIGLRVGGRGVPVRSGTGGDCTLDRIIPYRGVSIGLNEDTFEDPSWIAAQTGIVAVVRPGTVVKMDLAVIETGEIEGQVTSSAIGPHMIAELGDAKGIVLYTSYVDDDGVYVFSHVRTGDYTLRVSDSAGKSVGERTVKSTPAGRISLTFP